MCRRASCAWRSAWASTEAADAVELGVQLQGRHEVLGAGDLEVHVAERVLRAEDVGQRDVLGLALDLGGDQAHRDASDRALSGTPAFSSDMVLAQTEPIEVEPFELSASETCRIA